MSGIGKQLRGSGLARIVNKTIRNKRQKFDDGGAVSSLANLPSDVISANILNQQQPTNLALSPIAGYDEGGKVEPVKPEGNTLETYIKKLQQFGMSPKDINRHLEKMYPNDTYPGNE
jgi:flagellar basal body P-ring protein FlgI